jgi:hypothetical protein
MRKEQKRRGTHTKFCGKSHRGGLMRTFSCSSKESIKMDLKVIVYEDME